MKMPVVRSTGSAPGTSRPAGAVGPPALLRPGSVPPPHMLSVSHLAHLPHTRGPSGGEVSVPQSTHPGQGLRHEYSAGIPTAAAAGATRARVSDMAIASVKTVRMTACFLTRVI